MGVSVTGINTKSCEGEPQLRIVNPAAEKGPEFKNFPSIILTLRHSFKGAVCENWPLVEFLLCC